MKKIVLTGGGTLGHVAPTLALVPRLMELGYDVHYIGSKSPLERGAIEKLPIKFYPIHTGKLRRYISFENIKDAFKIPFGYFESLHLLRKIKPKIVFSKGGFVSVPVVYAARTLGIPVISHESDLSPGLATRLALPFAKKVCCNFEACAKRMGEKGVYSGLPLRKDIFMGDREKGLSMAGFSGKKPVLLMMGGSQGAVRINECLRQALDEILPKYDVFHICGKGNLSAELLNKEGYFQIELMLDDLKHALAAADFVLSRSGATALTEFHALNKPMLLIPLGSDASRGDQIENAERYEKKGLARVLLQEKMNPKSLAFELDKLYLDGEKIAQALKENPLPDAEKIIIDLIESCSLK